MAAEVRWRRQWLRLAARFAALLIDAHAPQIHRAVAIAAEVKILTIGRPDRIPVHRRVIGHAYDRLARILRARIDGPEIALRRFTDDAPVRNASSVRRPARLHAVAIEQKLPLPALHVDDPEAAHHAARRRREVDALRAANELLAIGRPRRIEAGAGDAPRRFASRAHHEDSAAFAFRAIRDLRSVGRERRLAVR